MADFDAESAQRIRRSRRISVALFGATALLGTAYLVFGIIERDASAGLIGVAVAVGAAAGAVGLQVVAQLGSQLDDHAQSLTQLRQRADAVEALAEQLMPTLNLSEFGRGDPSSLVAARTDRDAFPRLALDEAGQTRDTPGELDDLIGTAQDLRAAFRNAVYDRDFDQALAVGERIEAVYPDSPMAKQFRSLRESLRNKAS